MTEKQTILVSGATGNVGGGAAIALAKRGAQVVLLGRKGDKLQARAEAIRTALSDARTDHQPADLATLVVDLADMESVKLAAGEALSRFPKIHGLVLSAVALIQHGPNVLPNGHEVMFATNVMGPFLFTQLLVERMAESDGMVLHVINPSYKEIDWNDLESIKHHKTETAYERTKMMHRVIAAELARRYAGRISSVAFNPSFIIDTSDPELEKRVAMFELKQGNVEAAKSALRQALELHPHDARTLEALARIAERQGNRAEAAGYYERLLALIPTGHPDREAVQRTIDRLREER